MKQIRIVIVASGYSNTSYDENIFLLERLTCLTSMSTSPDFQIIFDKMPLAGLFQHTQKSHAKKKKPKKYSSLAKSNKKKKKKQNWLVMRSEWNSTIIPRILKGLTAYLRQIVIINLTFNLFFVTVQKTSSKSNDIVVFHPCIFSILKDRFLFWSLKRSYGPFRG